MVREVSITKNQLLNELENIGDFPVQLRDKVKRGKKQPTGFILGLIKNRESNMVHHPFNKDGTKRKLFDESRASKKQRFKNLKDISFKIMKQKDPRFKFTSIQFNKNNRTKLHTDAKNIGQSYILGLGDYTGGNIIIYDEKGQNPKSINIKNRFYKFNGSIYPHETAPFEGTRYTLVFYNVLR